MTKYTGSHVSNNTAVATVRPQVVTPAPSGFEPNEWEGFQGSIARAYAAGLLPQTIKTAEQALVIALKGRELGLEPMYALSSIHIVNGKPGLSAELMMALVRRKYPSAMIAIVSPQSKRNEECTVRTQRGTGPEQEFTFSIEDAKRAGLTGKDSWKNYPASMLRARAISAAVRATWPECVMGCYLEEELFNSAASVQQGAAKEIDDKFVQQVAPPVILEPPGDQTPEVTTEAEAIPEDLTCNECGSEMGVSIKNENELHCFKSRGGCGFTKPRG